MIDPLEAEIDANYDFFRRTLGDYLPEHHRQYAVIRHKRIVGFFDAVAEAGDAARRAYPDGLFSIQQVMDEPIDLGFFSHAGI
jgi:hypothetical protein